jgi:hypothetical protein
MSQQEIPKDWFEFMQKAWNPMSFPLPGMVTPTVDVEEIRKKITELKAVETWLTMNTGFVQMTIKTLEMQVSALDSLRAAGEAAGKAAGTAPPPGTVPGKK